MESIWLAFRGFSIYSLGVGPKGRIKTSYNGPLGSGYLITSLRLLVHIFTIYLIVNPCRKMQAIESQNHSRKYKVKDSRQAQDQKQFRIMTTSTTASDRSCLSEIRLHDYIRPITRMNVVFYINSQISLNLELTVQFSLQTTKEDLRTLSWVTTCEIRVQVVFL